MTTTASDPNYIKATYSTVGSCSELDAAILSGDEAVERWRAKMRAKAGAPAYAAIRIVFSDTAEIGALAKVGRPTGNVGNVNNTSGGNGSTDGLGG